MHPAVERLAAYSWRLLVISAVLGGALWMVGRLWVVFLPVIVALFLARILMPPVAWLSRRGLRPGLAAVAVLLGFFFLLGLGLTLIGMAVADQFAALGPTVGEAVDDLQRWLVEDSPFDLDRDDVTRFRREAGQVVGRGLRASGGALASGAVLFAEIVLGLVVGLIVTFFCLKDGRRFVSWARARLPEERRVLASRLAARSWRTLGAYLRGAALLGLVEGAVVAVTLTLVGAKLALPMALVTLVAAFVPVVGAVVAGVLAILVTLATAGAPAAGVVALVALVVQQLDNDILAPMVYGRALQLHPVVVLLGILAGGSAFGLVGSFLAVPVIATVVNAVDEARAHQRETSGAT